MSPTLCVIGTFTCLIGGIALCMFDIQIAGVPLACASGLFYVEGNQ